MSTASDAAAPAAGQQAPETGTPHKGALVFIDMQNIFADQDGQWGVSNYAEVEQAMARLRERDGSPVIWTRFVRDPEEHGAWADYYDRWDECRAEPESEVWDLTSPVRESDQVLSMPTFSKWGEQLAEMTKAPSVGGGRDGLLCDRDRAGRRGCRQMGYGAHGCVRRRNQGST